MHVVARFSSAILASVFLPAAALAATIEAGPSDDVESIIQALQPGDELVLADGDYTLSGRFDFDIAGTPTEPIVIRAAAGAAPHFHRPDASQNIWDFKASHVTLFGLRFSGGSAGLRVEAANHLRIEECEVFDTADVAIRMNDSGVTYEYVTLYRNHIHDTGGTGEGMYLGCNNDGCRMAFGVISNNWIHHTNAADVTQGDGIEVKEGSYGMEIRDNVIHDTNYPCILTYSTVGNGPPNMIERNVMWNCGDHGIQTAADATIQNNIVLSAANSGISLQPHQSGTPQNLTVVHNTVLVDGNAIAIRNPSGPVTVANNAVYSQFAAAMLGRGDMSLVTFSGNVGTGGLDQITGGYSDGNLANDFVGAVHGEPPSDVFPAAGGALVDTGDATFVNFDDFDVVSRDGVDVGAYEFSPGGSARWTIAPGFKTATTPAPEEPEEEGPDAGNPDAGPSDPADAGTTAQPDAGAAPDAGSPPSGDAGVDVGGNGGGDTQSDGCCSTAPPSAGNALLLLILGLLGGARRRRR